MELDRLLATVLRGAAVARSDASRILDELREGGHLSAGEAAQLEQAVDEAVGRARGLLGELREPVRGALRGLARWAGSSDELEDLQGRLRALEERLARLERDPR